MLQPGNLFVVDDIDEDGIREIGTYYSVCVSRYKSLKIFSLRGSRWKLIGESTFDVLTKDPTEVSFAKLVRKKGRNTFSICNFDEGSTYWETVRMK